MDNTAVPSFLRARVAAAKARASRAVQPTPQPQPAPPDELKAEPKATKPGKQPVAKTSRKQGSSQKIGKCDPGNGRNQVAALDDEAVIRMFAANAGGDPRVLDIAAPRLPAVMSAILDGAVMRGPGGHADRMTLFRMLGVPWTTNSPHHRVETGKAGGLATDATDAANRLTNALTRVERRLAGRVPVTLEAEVLDEPRQIGVEVE